MLNPRGEEVCRLSRVCCAENLSQGSTMCHVACRGTGAGTPGSRTAQRGSERLVGESKVSSHLSNSLKGKIETRVRATTVLVAAR